MVLPCILCHRELENVFKDDILDTNQPYKGTSFISRGHYGSTVFDPLDGSFIEINFCDECLIAEAALQNVLVYKRKRKNPEETWDPVPWSP